MPLRGRYVFLLKVQRLQRAEGLISIRKVTKFVQAYLRERSKELTLYNPELAEDPNLDHNYIGRVILLGAILKIIKNVLMFVSMAYFGGILWLIWCDISMTSITPDQPSFLLENDLNFMAEDATQRQTEIVLKVMYFMMTTMSTVGFGDMHPLSDPERLVCILIFLVGGAMFGIIMGDLI